MFSLIITTIQTAVSKAFKFYLHCLKFSNVSKSSFLICYVPLFLDLLEQCFSCLPDQGFAFYNWAVTCDFQQCGIFTSVDSDEPVKFPLKLTNSKLCSVSSLAVIEYSSVQTARMRRLIWGFAGRTYHIVGNLMHWPNYKYFFRNRQLIISILNFLQKKSLCCHSYYHIFLILSFSNNSL